MRRVALAVHCDHDGHILDLEFVDRLHGSLNRGDLHWHRPHPRDAGRRDGRCIGAAYSAGDRGERRFFGPRGVACVRGGGRGTGGDVERFVRAWVIRLLAGGFELTAALALPWPVARDYLEALREVEQGRLYELSLAMRAVGADEKGWRRWVEMVSRPKGKTGP